MYAVTRHALIQFAGDGMELGFDADHLSFWAGTLERPALWRAGEQDSRTQSQRGPEAPHVGRGPAVAGPGVQAREDHEFTGRKETKAFSTIRSRRRTGGRWRLSSGLECYSNLSRSTMELHLHMRFVTGGFRGRVPCLFLSIGQFRRPTMYERARCKSRFI